MLDPSSDPRVYFAAERTLLAWLRTGTALMGFGFVVARFGMLLRLLQMETGSLSSHRVSSYLGATLVGLGMASVAAGAFQYRRFCKGSALVIPKSTSPLFLLALSWALVLIGLLLAASLLA